MTYSEKLVTYCHISKCYWRRFIDCGQNDRKVVLIIAIMIQFASWNLTGNFFLYYLERICEHIVLISILQHRLNSFRHLLILFFRISVLKNLRIIMTIKVIKLKKQHLLKKHLVPNRKVLWREKIDHLHKCKWILNLSIFFIDWLSQWIILIIILFTYCLNSLILTIWCHHQVIDCLT